MGTITKSEWQRNNPEKRRKSKEKYYKTIKGHLSRVFESVQHRCNDSKHTGYKNYGGQGIQCKFINLQEFRDYVMNELKIDPRNLQIDRIDNNGHYELGNIRFVTCQENNCNKRKYKKREQ